MGIGNRPATCASCGKRLSRKQWYYRHGQYYCTKRCWVTAKAKAPSGIPPGAAQPPAEHAAGTAPSTPKAGATGA